MRDKKVLQHYGVDFPGLRYNMPELGPLRQRLDPDEKVDVRYRDELGFVWIFDKFRKHFLKVPCTNKDAIGLSRDIYDQARALVRKEGRNADDFPLAHKAYQQIMASVETEKHSQKLRVRRNAAKNVIDKEGQPKEKAAPTSSVAAIAKNSFPSFELDGDDADGFGVNTY